MFTQPFIASQLAHQRQREMLAQAGLQRLARQPREHARSTQHARRSSRRITYILKRTGPAALPS